MKKKNGIMTLDKLAIMIQEGFEETTKKTEVDDRFKEISEDMGLMNNHLDSIESELISIKKDLENVVYRRELEVLKDRVEAIERKVGIHH